MKSTEDDRYQCQILHNRTLKTKPMDQPTNILLLETATQVCSAAILRDGQRVDEINSDMPNAHSAKLATFIDKLLKNESVTRHGLQAVCVSSGPGSYTGLRIGVSSAKGICYALDIPLLSAPTLQNMAELYFAQHPHYQGLVCPMIDARRMECYTAIYSRQGEQKATSADVIEEGIYDNWLNNNIVTFIGDGAEKTRKLLAAHPNARYDNTFQISAAGMASTALRKLQNNEIEDIAYFEPFYLKDFVAKKSVVHGLR